MMRTSVGVLFYNALRSPLTTFPFSLKHSSLGYLGYWVAPFFTSYRDALIPTGDATHQWRKLVMAQNSTGRHTLSPHGRLQGPTPHQPSALAPTIPPRRVDFTVYSRGSALCLPVWGTCYPRRASPLSHYTSYASSPLHSLSLYPR